VGHERNGIKQFLRSMQLLRFRELSPNDQGKDKKSLICHSPFIVIVCRSQYRARESTSPPAESFAILWNGKTNIIVFLPTIQYIRTTNIFENKPLWNGSFFQKLVGVQLLRKLPFIFKHKVSLPVS
jgi:hypothetical protein